MANSEVMYNEEEFIKYVDGFYNEKTGIYPIANSKEIKLACKLYFATCTDYCGDSFDRENVRKILES